MNNRKFKLGFTLIELVMAMIVISIMATIAVAKHNNTVNDIERGINSDYSKLELLIDEFYTEYNDVPDQKTIRGWINNTLTLNDSITNYEIKPVNGNTVVIDYKKCNETDYGLFISVSNDKIDMNRENLNCDYIVDPSRVELPINNTPVDSNFVLGDVGEEIMESNTIDDEIELMENFLDEAIYKNNQIPIMYASTIHSLYPVQYRIYNAFGPSETIALTYRNTSSSIITSSLTLYIPNVIGYYYRFKKCNTSTSVYNGYNIKVFHRENPVYFTYDSCSGVRYMGKVEDIYTR